MEPRSLAGVSPPAIKADLKLPRRLLDSGALSREQVDTVAFATQTHELRNPDGSRRGFWLADMTGFGKGRQLAVLILKESVLRTYFAINTSSKEFTALQRLIRLRKDLVGRQAHLRDPAFAIKKLL